MGTSQPRRVRILVDLGKLRNLEVGLGEVSRRFGDELSRQLAGGDADDLEVDFLVPKAFQGRFGPAVGTRPIHPLHRILPVAGAYDVWHALHQDSSARPASSRVPLLLTIHDLNFLYEKSPAKARRRLRAIQRKVDRAAMVTAISRFTAGEVAEHLRLHGKPVEVIPNGVPDIPSRPAVRPPFVGAGTPFLFTVCRLTPKKNVHVLLDVARRLPEFLLVIAGEKETDYGREVARRVASEGIANVLLPGKVSDDEKSWLHQNAAAFLFPSLYEGFGLPVIEAMSCGKPVFTGRSTSLPEVAGEAGFYFDSFEAEAMEKVFREGMRAFHADPAGCSERARRNAARFRWDRNVRAYCDLYRRLGRGTPTP